MVVLELLTVAGAGYTGYSAWLMGRFYRPAAATGAGLGCATTSATGIQFYRRKDSYVPPVYINSGSPGHVGIGIPVGGGMVQEREFVFSRWQVNSEDKIVKFNGLCGSHDPNVSKIWINTAENFAATMQTYGISTEEFPATLPLRALRFSWDGPVWYDLPSAAVSCNRIWVARKATLARRLPLTFVVAGATLISVSYLTYKWRQFKGAAS